MLQQPPRKAMSVVRYLRMCRVYLATLSRVSWALAPLYQWRYLMTRRSHNHTLKNIWRNLKKKNMQRRDSNPQRTKTEHFGNIGPNSAGEPVLVSDGLPKATVHLYWPPRARSLPLTSFQVGFVFWRSRVLNSSPGQAVGTVEIVGQHQPSDKYLYQLRACACTLVQRLGVSFKLSCLRPFSVHAKSRSRA